MPHKHKTKKVQSLVSRLSRKKLIDSGNDSNLKRCLGICDLTALGIGSTLGVGIYILAGQISKYDAGPAVILSFLIAAIASIFAGLCYAEFGARVPKAGSAYVYCYVSIGELVAFLMGWSMILSYGIGAASVAKGFSQNVDSITEGKLYDGLLSVVTMDVPVMAETIDFLAFGITTALTFLLSFGVKESTIVNNILTFINLGVVVFVIITGAMNADTENWNVSKEEIEANYTELCICAENSTTNPHRCRDMAEGTAICGEGGFAPFGFTGIVSGAASAFYGFVGFDVIATVGEEVKDPKKAVPISIVVSLLTVFLAYCGISTVVTLDLPYFLQDENAPLPHVFKTVGWVWAAWVVRIGAFFGLFASLLGSMIPLPRIMWAMASDGLFFECFSYVHPRFQTPIWATLLTGISAAIMSALFDLGILIDLMSIGTLLAYTMVSACIMLLRYRMTEYDEKLAKSNEPNAVQRKNANSYMAQLLNLNNLRIPNEISSNIASTFTWIFCVLSIMTTGFIRVSSDALASGSLMPIVALAIFGTLLLLCVLVLARQPPSRHVVSFQVPLVPFIPCVSIVMNVYLMVNLQIYTWLQFAVYILLGLLIYFSYGIWHSKAANDEELEVEAHLSPVGSPVTSPVFEKKMIDYLGPTFSPEIPHLHLHRNRTLISGSEYKRSMASLRASTIVDDSSSPIHSLSPSDSADDLRKSSKTRKVGRRTVSMSE